MTAPTADEPVAGYDDRKVVVNKLRRLRHLSERQRKCKALSINEVVATLRRFQALRVAPRHRDLKR